VHPSRNLGRTGRRGLPDGAAGSSLSALRGEPEQVRQIDALLEFLDPLAELTAPTRRIGIHLLAGGDGPDRGVQWLLQESWRSPRWCRTPRPTTARRG
jgi:hypothetical protein